MTNVHDVARYILNQLGEMTTMKLQKLVYYCQAWSLAWDEIPLFEEEIQAWANGPVCPDLFEIHKGVFTLEASDIKNMSGCPFTEDQDETMKAVLEYYGDKSPQWLSELTHKEAPWKEARKGYPDGAACTNIITKDSMQQYYGGL